MTSQTGIHVFLKGFSFGKLLIIRILQQNSKKNIPKGLNLAALALSKGCHPCMVDEDDNLPSQGNA